MLISHAAAPPDTLGTMLDRLSADDAARSNCAFQLALMVARIAIEPGSEAYKEESARVLLDLIRSKPRGNVVPLFGAAPGRRQAGPPRHTCA